MQRRLALAASRLLVEAQGAGSGQCCGRAQHWHLLPPLPSAAAAAQTANWQTAAAWPPHTPSFGLRWHSDMVERKGAEQREFVYEAPFGNMVSRVKASVRSCCRAACWMAVHLTHRCWQAPVLNLTIVCVAMQKLSLFSCMCALGAGPIILGLDTGTSITAKASIVATLAAFGVFTTGLVRQPCRGGLCAQGCTEQAGWLTCVAYADSGQSQTPCPAPPPTPCSSPGSPPPTSPACATTPPAARSRPPA
jgi:hypothetical protein